MLHQTELGVNADEGGSLIVDEGASLVYDGCGGNIFLNTQNSNNNSAALVVLGTLRTNGVTVNPGCSLITTVHGQADIERLFLGGTVRVEGDAQLSVYRQLEHQGGTVEVYDSGRAFLPGDGLTSDEQLANISFPVNDEHPNNTALVLRLYRAGNDNELNAALSAAANPPAHFGTLIDVDYAWTIDDSFTAPAYTHIAVNKGLEVNGEYHIGNQGVLIAKSNITVNGEGAIVGGGAESDSRVRVNSGCVLSSSGVVDIEHLDLGGTVEVRGKVFRVNVGLNNQGGTIQVYDGFNIFPAEGVLPKPGVIVTNGNVKTNLLFSPQTNEQAAEAITVVNGLDDRFVGDIRIEFPWELSGKNVFRHKAEIRVNADRGGSLHLAQDALLANNGNGGNVFIENHSNSQNAAVSEIYGELNTNGLSLASGCELKVGENGWVKTHDRLNIPEGAKLILEKGQLQLMDNSVAEVGGTLVNGGFIDMHQRSGSAPRLLIDGGNYSGGGRLGVKDIVNPDSYFSGLDLTSYVKMTDGAGTQYILVDADLILPNDLTTIESGAFAGDIFKSVYISPNVTVIEDDAFAGMSGLTIYGFPKTAAQGFAEAKGYTFVNVG